MTKENANHVFDILVRFAGADEHLRDEFVSYQLEEGGHKEFRFIGKLGFGGKYWTNSNRVSCYQESMTEERREIIATTNEVLRVLATNYFINH